MPANRSYFLAHNLLPPLIPMLSAAFENYIKIAASLNVLGNTNSLSSKTSVENFESVSEVLEGFIWTATAIIGHICSDDRQTQMKDYLLELVIAYQVIHRLRELFALHDRPQVEGSSFPSSIILSLNMLVVLTSRSGTISSIDWGSFTSKLSSERQELKYAESLVLEDSFSNVADGDHKSVSSELHTIRDVPLSDVPEDRPLGECKMRRHDGVNSEKQRTEASTDINQVSSLQMQMADASGNNVPNSKQPVAFLLSVIAETGLVSLPSLLTAVLLQANNRLSSEQ
ncbi:S phase cyclin a-associated in the endoplasmic reticulum, partial [Thalictrum thalictroides]